MKKAQFDFASGQNTLFRNANLYRAKFLNADFSSSEMIKTDLRRANFQDAILKRTNFYSSNLRNANFRYANLKGASFMLTNLTGADFTGADLEGANLQGAQLIGTNFTNANINKCAVYGASVWQVNLTNCQQQDLIVTRQSKFTNHHKPETIITVDNLQVSQFVYLLIQNQNIRTILDTITSKLILILGRFTEERMEILDSLRNELRAYNYLPVLFDFENSNNRDITETVSTLAHLSRFVIADLTDPKSIPHELSHIIPNLPSVPVMPIIEKGQQEYSMFEHFQRYPWVLNIHTYENKDALILELKSKIIEPSENKAFEMKNSRPVR